MLSYKEELSFTIENDKNAVVEGIRSSAKNISVNGDNIEIRRHNSFLHLLAPTGKINIKAEPGSTEYETKLQCEIKPSIFTVRSAVGFTILSIVVWSLIFWFFPLNVYMSAIFIVHWVIMCFVALYLLVGFMALLTIMLLIYNFNDFPLQYVIVAWLVTLWITHLTLRYNKASLKQHLMDIISRIKSQRSELSVDS